MNAKLLLISTLISAALPFFGTPVFGNVTPAPERFNIFRADGSRATLEDIVARMRSTDVIFIGEAHDDSIAHELELELLRRAAGLAQASTPARRVILSLEMFERDAQIVLDEYLAGLITETHFLNASRPWDNYRTDYRPLIEFARENRLPVVAANAPRRYVNRVSRLGRTSLTELSPAARLWLAPLPYAEASSAYATKFSRLMAGMPSAQNRSSTSNSPNPHSSTLLDAQSLWDATMAHSIAENLKLTPNPLLLHVNGKFHSDDRLGAPEHLLRYRPATRLLVITITPRSEVTTANAPRLNNPEDFLILTDSNSPPTPAR